jgi:hypothetical protein
MTEVDLELLKASIDKIVRIICYDGEIMTAKVNLVSEEDEDLIYDLISTTKESMYEKHDKQPAYLIRFKEIERVERLQQTA